MHEEVLTKELKILLNRFGKTQLPSGSYLSGGTAVALHLGHRKSLDLDFFSPVEFEESQWEQKLENDLGYRAIKKDWQTLIGEIGTIKLALFYYKYPPINKLSRFGVIHVASLPDLAAMKLSTILSRGTRRDLVDLYFLVKKYGLAKMFGFYDKKYKNLESQELALRKSLVFFDEANDDEMPQMLIPISWDKIKSDLITMSKTN